MPETVWQEADPEAVMGGGPRFWFRLRVLYSPSLSPAAACGTLRRYVQFSGVKSANLAHGTQGKGKTPKEILKRIDYGGIITNLIWVCEFLNFLSKRLA